MKQSIIASLCTLVFVFVRRSAKLDAVSSQSTLIIDIAVVSLTLWKATLLCFLVSVASSLRAVLVIALLSQNTSASFLIGTPN